MSKFDSVVNYDLFSDSDSKKLHQILDEAECHVNKTLSKVCGKMKEEKRILIDDIEKDIVKSVKKFIQDRSYGRHPLCIVEEIKDAHNLLFNVHASSFYDITTYYLGPKL